MRAQKSSFASRESKLGLDSVQNPAHEAAGHTDYVAMEDGDDDGGHEMLGTETSATQRAQ